MATTPARQKLRALLDQGELVVAPGVFDGITAHLARRTGQAAAYMTGAGVAASGFGLPDIGMFDHGFANPPYHPALGTASVISA